jgi:hypothetical protein
VAPRRSRLLILTPESPRFLRVFMPNSGGLRAQPIEQSDPRLPRVSLGFAARDPEEAHALIDEEGREPVHQRPRGERLIPYGLVADVA